MKIALVSTKSWPMRGGMQRYVFSLCKGLRSVGHDAVIYTRFVKKNKWGNIASIKDYEESENRCYEGCPIRVVGPSASEATLMKALRPFLGRRPLTQYAERLVVKILERQFEREIQRADVIHYSGRPDEFLYKAIRSKYINKSIPIYITPHIHVGKLGSSEADVEEYKRLSGVIALTNVEKRWLIENGVNDSKIYTVGHAVTSSGKGSVQNFQTDYNLTKRNVVLYLGRQTKNKGLFRLLDCVDTVWETLNDTIFVVAGPKVGQNSEVESKYAKLFEDGRIINLGLVSEDEKEDLLATCDILCLPSTVEAFGLVYMEAWSYGKPTVALDIPTVSELHNRSGAGLVVENNADAVAEALIELLSDDSKYQRLSRAALDFVKNETWERVAEEMTKAYQN